MEELPYVNTFNSLYVIENRRKIKNSLGIVFEKGVDKLELYIRGLSRIVSSAISIVSFYVDILPKKLLWILQIDEFIPPSVVRILFRIGSGSFSKGSIFWRLNDKLHERFKSKPLHNLLQSTLLTLSIRIFVQ